MQEVPEIKSEQICSTCHAASPASAYFCANCGKPLHEKPPPISLYGQAYVYAISFFIPPSGFWYGWKYLKQSDQASRRIGTLAIILTLVSIIISFWIIQAMINSLSQGMTSDLNGLGL